MFDLTTLDYIFIGVLFASTIWASIRGGVYETVATLSWVVAAIAARFASPLLDKLLQNFFDLSDSTVGTLVASYFIVFFVILMLVGFFNQKLRDKIQNSMMKVTDRTLGILFGIVRGVVVMGIAYWIALWYYSDSTVLPKWVADAKLRPIMRVTALKLDEWFIPGDVNKLLQRDVAAANESIELYKNLINPSVVDKGKVNSAPAKVTNAGQPSEEKVDEVTDETGYKSSERTALENQLLQIENAARAEEERNLEQQEQNLETDILM